LIDKRIGFTIDLEQPPMHKINKNNMKTNIFSYWLDKIPMPNIYKVHLVIELTKYALREYTPDDIVIKYDTYPEQPYSCDVLMYRFKYISSTLAKEIPNYSCVSLYQEDYIDSDYTRNCIYEKIEINSVKWCEPCKNVFNRIMVNFVDMRELIYSYVGPNQIKLN
jgi:hypothetical protein